MDILPENSVKYCQMHGYLSLEQVYLHKRGKYCRQCKSIKNKERKSIILDPSITERKCGCCKLILPLNSFSPAQNKQRWPICRSCRVNYSSRLRAKHKYHFKKWYNLTLEQYNSILTAQHNRCAICERTANEAQPGKANNFENNLSVDHCHKLDKLGTIAIRGLLCFSCNSTLGKWNDDIRLFKKAIKYLKKEPVLITKT